MSLKVSEGGDIKEFEAIKANLGESAIDDLERIEKVIQENNIFDFQLLVSGDGKRVFIDDPAGFTPNVQGDSNHIEFVQELLEAARNNTGK